MIGACLIGCLALSIPAQAQTSPVLFRDDFNATFDTSKWTVYDNSQAYGRTQFGNIPSIVSANGTTFARLTLSNYNYNNNASFPFKGTEMFSPLFTLGIGKEMEARVRATNLPSGLVAAFWAYGSQGTYGNSDFRSDEIDIELLTKQPHNSLLFTNWNDWDPSNPTYSDGIHHAGWSDTVSGLDWTGWNVYKIRWLPDRTEWYANGALVRTGVPAHPNGPLAVRFNVWAPDNTWQDAYDAGLATTTNSSNAATYNYDVDWVEVRSVVPTLTLSVTPNTFSEAAGTTAAVGTVTRNTDSTSALVVNLTSSNVGGATVPGQVTIPAGALAQTFPVAAVDNAIVDGTRTLAITATADQFTTGTAPLTVTDNDVAGITVNPTTGLRTTESGGTATFTVALTSQPLNPVRIDLNSAQPHEGVPYPASLTFTDANWNVPQTVTVTGVDDFVQDGDQAYTIITAPAVSADSVYNGFKAADVAVVNADNDTARIIVTPTSGLQTSEAGGTATFTVRLNSQPTANVTLSLNSTNLVEGTVSSTALLFTATDWNIPQTVTVRGADDNLVDGDIPYTIIIGAPLSADAVYSALPVASIPAVQVINRDNDVAGITVTPLTALTTSESGGAATLSVALTSQPAANVTLSFTSSNPNEGLTPSVALLFTPANWNLAQTLTVTGVDDAVVDGVQPYGITIAPASVDTVYQAAKPVSLALTNFDNDTPMLTLNFAPTSVSEAGGVALGTVTRNTATSSALTVNLASSNANKLTVPATVTIPIGQAAASFNVAAVDNSLADGPQPVTINASADGFAPVGAVVTVTDNDVASLSLVADTTTFNELAGATAAVGTVGRNSQLDAPLTVTLTSSDTNAVTVPTTIMIPAGQTAASFALTAVYDQAATGPRAALITASAAATGLTTNITVTVTDSPLPVLTLTTSAPSLREADGTAPASATVTRNIAPTVPLTINLSSSNPGKLTVPATVTLAAGQTTVTFPLNVVDDKIASGSQPVTLGASAADSVAATTSVTVTDDDEPTLSLSLSKDHFSEAAGAQAALATLTRNTPVTGALTVTLSSSNAARVKVPARVTFAAGARAVSFPVAAVNNTSADGPQRVTLRASANGFSAVTGAATVQDDEAASNLSLSGQITVPLITATGSTVLRPVPSVEVKLFTGTTLRDSATTDSKGGYRFASLPSGRYSVIPTSPSYKFAPRARSLTLTDTSVANMSFDATPNGHIGGQLTRRLGNGGLQPLSGITVKASYARGTLQTKTDVNGRYAFDGLAFATYVVVPVLPGAYFSPGLQTAGLIPAKPLLNALDFVSVG